jgi:hypothetical protein
VSCLIAATAGRCSTIIPVGDGVSIRLSFVAPSRPKDQGRAGGYARPPKRRDVAGVQRVAALPIQRATRPVPQRQAQPRSKPPHTIAADRPFNPEKSTEVRSPPATADLWPFNRPVTPAFLGSGGYHYQHKACWLNGLGLQAGFPHRLPAFLVGRPGYVACLCGNQRRKRTFSDFRHLGCPREKE